eukprot:SAG11_NODE_20302_length_448_cov_1.186246_1_plen_68_part_00
MIGHLDKSSTLISVSRQYTVARGGPQTDPWVWQVVEYAAAEAVLGFDFRFRDELEMTVVILYTERKL